MGSLFRSRGSFSITVVVAKSCDSCLGIVVGCSLFGLITAIGYVNSTPSRLVWLVLGWSQVVHLLLWVVLWAMTVGVWTVVVAKGRDSGRGPSIYVGIEGGWSATAGNGLLEMPIPF